MAEVLELLSKNQITLCKGVSNRKVDFAFYLAVVLPWINEWHAV